MKAYTHVGDFTHANAFLTAADACDVAFLERLQPKDFGAPDNPDAAGYCMSDEEWRAAVGLINAAPLMLSALRAIVARINGEYDNPDLVALAGPLAKRPDDCRRIAMAAVEEATCFD